MNRYKLDILKIYFKGILLYGAESWTTKIEIIMRMIVLFLRCNCLNNLMMQIDNNAKEKIAKFKSWK